MQTLPSIDSFGMDGYVGMGSLGLSNTTNISNTPNYSTTNPNSIGAGLSTSRSGIGTDVMVDKNATQVREEDLGNQFSTVSNKANILESHPGCGNIVSYDSKLELTNPALAKQYKESNSRVSACAKTVIKKTSPKDIGKVNPNHANDIIDNLNQPNSQSQQGFDIKSMLTTKNLIIAGIAVVGVYLLID